MFATRVRAGRALSLGRAVCAEPCRRSACRDDWPYIRVPLRRPSLMVAARVKTA